MAVAIYQQTWSGTALYVESWGTPVVPEPPVQSQTPAGRRRRRYIFPDGTQVLATQEEAYELLQLFVRPKEEPKRKKKSVKMAPIVLEDVKWVRAEDSVDTYKPVLKETFIWRPNPKDLEAALRKLKRRRDDEAVLV